MTKQLAIIQLKEKTTLLQQAHQKIASLQHEVQTLQERLTWADKVEDQNEVYRKQNFVLREKINAVKFALE